MKFVYLLWHTHSDESLLCGEDIKLIGVYASKEHAEEAQSRAGQLEGFKDHLEGFEISCNELDKDEWTSGFMTERAEMTDIDELLNALLKTSNLSVANTIAFRLKEFRDNRIPEAIIEVISRPESHNKRAKLIYCCDGYDCTKYFELFIQIVLEEGGESCINAIDIISEMKGPFLNDQLSGAVSKIEAYIDVNKYDDKITYLKKLKKYLKRLI